MPTLDAVEVIKSTVKDLVDKVEAAQEEWQGAQEERQKEIEASIQEMQKQIEGLTKAAASRPGLPGVEVAKAGEKDTAGRKFHFGRMVKLICRTADPKDKEYGYEMEVHRQAQAQLEKAGQSDFLTKTAINAGTDSAGGFFYIPHEVQAEMIPYLEAEEIGVSLGATVITGLVGNVSWVVDDGVPVAYYVDTEAEEAITESVNSFSNIEMRPRVLGAAVPISWSMQTQPARALDTWLQTRIGKQFALKEDYVLFLGSGKTEPRGILNDPGINTHTWAGTLRYGDASNNQNITDDLRLMLKAVADQNALPMSGGRRGWATDSNGFFALPQVKDADGRPLFQAPADATVQRIMGAPIGYTTQLDSGDNTDQTLLFGDFSQVLIGRWGTMAFAASQETETNFRKMRTTIRGVMAHDVAVLQAKAFCKASGFDVSSVI